MDRHSDADRASPRDAHTIIGGGRSQQSVAHWQTVHDPDLLAAIVDTIFTAVSSVYESDRPCPDNLDT
jgi:hypothetical protein